MRFVAGMALIMCITHLPLHEKNVVCYIYYSDTKFELFNQELLKEVMHLIFRVKVTKEATHIM